MTSPITVVLSDSNRNLKLSQTQDYILQCVNPETVTWGLVVWGGHNIELQDCDWDNSAASYGAQFKDQTGTLYLHDDHFAGPALAEGIDLQEPGNVTVVMRDILIDTVHGSQSTNHADCLQLWSGPQRLLVDGFTCTTTYQGFFLLPNNQDASTIESIYDFRNVNIHATGAYPWTLADVGPSYLGTVDLWTQNIWVDGAGEPRMYPGDDGFEDVQTGTPPYGDFVTAASTGATGVDEPANGIDPAPLLGEQ
jgi:hypothetical protein